MKRFSFVLLILMIFSFFFGRSYSKSPQSTFTLPTAHAVRQDLRMEIKTIGELEASRSITISSSIKGDQGKIVEIISDGLSVEPGQTLVKLDPTPFEEKITKLRIKLKEQEAYLYGLEKALEWEILQTQHKNQTVDFEVESAQLELDKIVYGDGPQEISRLKNAMQKAWMKFDELNAYSQDLADLEAQGFLNPTEAKQAQKKLGEEQENYEIAKQQYDTYLEHVYPMMIKKAQTLLKRAQIAQEESKKAGTYAIAKAKALIDQAQQAKQEVALQLREAKQELRQTDIQAPTCGMVVLREEYRSGQKRKPRVGDIVVKNQPLIDLPDLSCMLVKTRVREIDLYKVKVGKKATIQVDAYPHLLLEGTVSAIGVLALSEFGRGEEKHFEIKIALHTLEGDLRPGMTTRVTIHAQEAHDVLTIPLHAIFEENKQLYCYVRQPDGTFQKRGMETGVHNEQWSEVISGVQEGEEICLINPLRN